MTDLAKVIGIYSGTGDLLEIDRIQYFGSEKLHRPKCLVKTSDKRAVRYEPKS